MVAIVTGASLGLGRTSVAELGSAGELGPEGQAGYSSNVGLFGENVYVNAANGNLVIERTDEYLAGVGLNDDLTSVYNSLAQTSAYGPMGGASGYWQTNDGISVGTLSGTYGATGSYVNVTGGDGTVYTYTWNGTVYDPNSGNTGAYVCTEAGNAGNRLTLSSNTWSLWYGKTGVTDYFSSTHSGRITKSIDANNNSLTYAYNSSGYLSTVTSSDGEYTSLTYSGADLTGVTTYYFADAADASTETYSTLSDVTYNYDSSNRLSSVVTQTSGSNSVAITYGYTNASNPNLVTSISQTGGEQLTIGYTQVGSNFLVTSLTQTLATGVTTTTGFTYGTGTTTITDNAGNQTVLTYDSLGQLLSVQTPPAQSGATAETTTYTYNSDGDVATATNALGTTQYFYDSNDNLTEVIDPLGTTTTTYTYDTNNHMLTATTTTGSQTSTINYAYDGNENLEFIVAADGQVTQYTHNARGQLISAATYPDDTYNLTTFTSAAISGWVGALSDLALTNLTKYTYDYRGNPASTTTFSAVNSTGTNGATGALKMIVNYIFDLHGNLLSKMTSDGGSVAYGSTYAYDGLNRIIATTSQDGNSSTITYNDPGDTTTVTLGDGLTTVDTYNWAGQLISTLQSGTGTIAATTTYQYDSLGNLCAVTDPNGNTTYFLYDNMGRKVATIAADGSMTRTIYNQANQVAATVIYANRLTTSQMTSIEATNSSGELDDPALSTVLPTSSSSDIWNWNVYDDDGRLIETIDGDGDATVYAYAPFSNVAATTAYVNALATTTLWDFTPPSPTISSNLVSVTAYANALSPSTISGFKTTPPTSLQLPTADPGVDETTRSFYNNEGQLIGTLNAQGYLTENIYNNSGQLIQTTQFATQANSSLWATGTFSALLSSVGTTSQDESTRYFYDDRGLMVYSLNANLVPTEYDYDSGGNLIDTIQYAGSITSTTSYSTSYVQSEIASELAGNSANQTTWYVYDTTTDSLDFKIDAMGDVTEYTCNTLGQVTQTTQFATLDVRTTAPYLSAMVSWAGVHSTGNTITSNVYNIAGQLVYTIDAMGDVTQYIYDADGHVIQETQFATTDPVTSSPSEATMDSWASTNSSNIQNRITLNIYNQDGQLAYKVTPTNDTGSAYYSTVTQYGYNTAGQLTSQIVYATEYAVSPGTTAASMAAMLPTTPPSSAEVTGFSYDAAGRITDTVNAAGIDTHVVYDALGRVTSSTVAYGTTQAATTSYTYDIENRLLTESVVPGDSEATATTTYTYDAFGRVHTVTDPKGGVTTYTYDLLGNVLTTKDGTGAVTTDTYDAFGNVLTSTDALGNETYFFYDNLNRLVLEVDPLDYATGTTYTILSQVASVTNYATPVTGTITPGIAPTVTADPGYDATTTFTRNLLGQVTKETDPAGYYVSYTYDAFGDQLTMRNKLGGTIDYTYDNCGLMLSEVLPENDYISGSTYEATSVTNTYSYDAFGNRTQMIEAYGLTEQRTTTYTYDLMNRLTTVTGDAVTVTNPTTLATATGVVPVTTYVYDDRGNLIEAVDPAGAKTFYYYDLLNRKIAEVDGLGDLSVWFYDANGNVSTATVYGTAVTLPTSPGGTPPSAVNPTVNQQTTYTYDHDNRLLTTTVASVLTGSYNGAIYTTSTGNITTSNTYNADGDLVQTTDGNGNSAYYYYDADGRKIAELDPDKYLTTYVLNPFGNVLTEQQYAIQLTSTPPTTASTLAAIDSYATASINDRISTFTYDLDGNTLTETRENVAASTVGVGGALSTATANSTITYTYNGFGQVLTVTQATGDVTTYTYDTMGRLSTQKESAFNNYNGVSVIDEIVNNYNGLNELTRTYQKDGGTGATMPTRYTYYTYGPDGWLLTMEDPTTFTRTYGHDIDGRIISISYSNEQSNNSYITQADVYQYDALGRQISNTTATLTGSSWTFGDDAYQTQYNTYGEVSASGVNGTWQTTYSYDNAGRLSEETSIADGTKLFMYDADGNQTMEVASSGAALPSGYTWSSLATAQAIAILTNTYTGHSGSSYSIGAFNTTTLGLVANFTAYDARDMAVETIAPFSEMSPNGSGGYNTATLTTSQTYDAFGDVLSTTDASGNLTQYVYSTLGNVLEEEQPGTIITHYFYDISGRQVGITDPNGNTTTVTLLANSGYGGSAALVLEQFNPDGSTVSNGYDAFNELAQSTDGDGDITTYTYDKMGRLTQQNDPSVAAGSPGNPSGSAVQLIDYFAYDGLGLQIQAWNNELGSTHKTTTDYDAEGRVISTTDQNGNTITDAYSVTAHTTTIGDNGLTTVDTYNTAGQLITSAQSGADIVPATTTYAYDSRGNLCMVTDPDGNKTYYIYDNLNRQVATIRSDGSMTETIYTADNQVAATVVFANLLTTAQMNTLVSGGVPVDPSLTTLLPTASTSDIWTWNIYDNDNRLAETINGDGDATIYGYDADSNLTSTTAYANALSSSAISGFKTTLPTTVQTPTADPGADEVTRNFYDSMDRLIGTLNAEGYVTYSQYDSAGRKVETTAFATQAAAGLWASGTLSALLSSVGTSSSDESTRYFYDSRGLLVYSLNASLVPTEYDYDDLGNLIETVRYGGAITPTSTYTASYVQSQIGSTLGSAVKEKTWYVYDTTTGNLDFVIDATGDVTEYAYNSLGKVVQTTQFTTPDPLTSSPTLAAMQSWAGSNSTGAEVASDVYNIAGQLAYAIDGDGNVTEYQYDADGNVITETKFATQDPVTSSPTETAMDSWASSNSSNMNNDIVRSVYDQDGRLAYTLAAMNYSGTTMNYAVTAYAYNTSDLVTAKTQYAIADGLGLTQPSLSAMTSWASANYAGDRTTTYTYDAANRLTEEVDPPATVTNTSTLATSSVNPTTYYTYDAFGNLVETEDPTTATTFAYYNALNEKVAGVNADGALVTWGYDAFGNTATQTAYAGEIPTSAGISPSTSVATLVSDANAVGPTANNRQTNYTYTQENQLASTTTLNVETGYWNLTYYQTTTSSSSIGTSNTYDSFGNLVSAEDGDGNYTYYYYDADNRKIAEVDPDKYLTTYTLDQKGNVVSETQYQYQLTGTVNASSSVSSLVSSIPSLTADHVNDRVTTFTYDADGNRLTETRDNVQTWTIVGNSVTPVTTNSEVIYTYNHLGEIASVTQATGDETTYGYDNMGRLVQTQESAITTPSGSAQNTVANTYDSFNDLVETNEFDADNPTTTFRKTYYTYQTNGWLASMEDPTTFVRNYGYDADGRTVSTTYLLAQPSGSPVNTAQIVQYDAMGQQILQSTDTESGSTWSPFGDSYGTKYDAFGEVIAQGAHGMWQQTNSYNNAGQLWSTTANNGTVQLYMYDADGNQTMEIDSSGAALPSAYNWSTMTMAEASAILTNTYTGHTGSSHAIGAFDTTTLGMVMSFTTYDARDEEVGTVQPFRQLSVTGGTFTTATLTTSQGYDAFGDVVTQTDANTNTTTYTYSMLGNMLSMIQPSVSYTTIESVTVGGVNYLEPVTGTITPITYYYYDKSGRQIGEGDPNGNTTTETLLANSGYNGTKALVLETFNPDESVTSDLYDVFGDLAQSSAVGVTGDVTNYTYDGDGRLTYQYDPIRPAHSPGNSSASAVELIDQYAYDGLGERIKSWNNEAGTGVATTQYDAEGRIIKTVDMAGLTTSYSYSWSSTQATPGLGTFGAWTKTTVNPEGLSETETQDYFGRMVSETDFGGNVYANTYDLAGRLVSQQLTTTSAGSTTTYTYYNTNEVSSEDQAYGNTASVEYREISTYNYDANGNRTTEVTEQSNISGGVTQPTTYYENATVTWDALNRMVGLTDAGSDTATLKNVTWYYDLDGNVVNQVSNYYPLTSYGSNSLTAAPTQTEWYAYDSMNRVVLSDGQQEGSYINQGLYGTTYTYNAAGERATSDISELTFTGSFPDFAFAFYSVQDNYTYTDDGYLAQVNEVIGTPTSWQSTDAYVQPPPATGTGTELASYVMDAMGRVTNQTEYNSSGTAVYTKLASYDADSNVTSDTISTVRSGGGGYFVQGDTYYYGAYDSTDHLYDGAYQGALMETLTTLTDNGSAEPTTQTVNYYVWTSAPQLNMITYTPNTSNPGTFYDTYYYYNSYTQNLYEVAINDGTPRTISYLTNQEGQILSSVNSKGPAASYYFFDGTQEGVVSNNGTTNITYDAAITQQTATPGSGYFTGGSTTDTPFAAFGTQIESINGLDANQTQPSYTVEPGDTLQSIAQGLWGDSSYWYLLADANGLSPDAQLQAGQTLVIPTLASNSNNNASTNSVYNATQAEGNTSPTHPPHASHGSGCGIIGEIILAVIAIVVTIYTAGALSAPMASLFASMGASTAVAGTTVAAGTIAAGSEAAVLGGIAAGAVGAAAGSVVSQGVGLASGMQSKFNWAAVGEAAIGGAADAGFAGADAFEDIGDDIGDAVDNTFGDYGDIAANVVTGGLQGAAGSIISQGIGMATGLQSKFGWASVAAAGLGQGVGAGVSEAIGDTDFGLDPYMNGVANYAIAGTAGAIVSAATKTALGSGSFGDNFANAIPDVISEAIGDTDFGFDPYMNGVASYAIAGTAGAIASAATKTALGSGSFGDNFANAIPDVIGQTIGNAIASDQAPTQWTGPDSSPQVASASQGDTYTTGLGDSGSNPNIQTAAYVVASDGEPSQQSEEGEGLLSWLGDQVQSGMAWVGREVDTYVIEPAESLLGIGTANVPAPSPSATDPEQVVVTGYKPGPLEDFLGSAGQVISNVFHGVDGAITDLSNDIISARRDPVGFAANEFNWGYNVASSTISKAYDFATNPLSISNQIAVEHDADELSAYASTRPFGLAGTVVAGAAVYGGPALLGGGEAELLLPDLAASAPEVDLATESAETEVLTTGQLRNTPGIVTAGGDLAPASGVWLKAGVPAPIPSQVADALVGQQFNSFGALRSAIWENVAGNEDLNGAFSPGNLGNMEAGYAPFAPPEFQVNTSDAGMRFNLHHIVPIEEGGAVYDLSNIQIVDPRTHYFIHYGP